MTIGIIINLAITVIGFLSAGVVLIYKLGGFFKSVNINFKNINTKLGNLENNYESLNAKIDTKIDKINNDIKELSNNFDKKIDKLDSKIDKVEVELKDSINKLDSKIDKINNEIKELATSNATIKTKIENIESRLVKFDEKYMVYFANKLMDTIKETKWNKMEQK